jgi:hypothetical protein
LCKPPPKLPNDPLTTQTRFWVLNHRNTFRIYGREGYDFWATPSRRISRVIFNVHSRLASSIALRTAGMSPPVSDLERAQQPELHLMWDCYCAAGRIVGVPMEDIAAQIIAEYGADPRPWLGEPSASEKRIASEVFKRRALRFMNKARRATKCESEKSYVFPLDDDGNLVWEPMDDQWNFGVMAIPKIMKDEDVVELMYDAGGTDKDRGLPEEMEANPEWDVPTCSILRWI